MGMMAPGTKEEDYNEVFNLFLVVPPLEIAGSRIVSIAYGNRRIQYCFWVFNYLDKQIYNASELLGILPSFPF